jgi:ubiquinone/menaquinone biosynthesis C-methylase UbiE
MRDEGSFYRRLGALFAPRRAAPRLTPRQAYKRWSETYDDQPDNVFLALEDDLFQVLLYDLQVEGRVVVDVGCGTGRHWDRLLSLAPTSVHGIDNSPEMLSRLRARFPDAPLHLRTGSRLEPLADASADVLISTLMLGHEPRVEGELREWVRVLRPGGDVVLTDFHPEASRAGMKRTFRHHGRTFEVEHHVHTVSALRTLFTELGLDVMAHGERFFDPNRPGAATTPVPLETLRATSGTPVVLGFHLRKRA